MIALHMHDPESSVLEIALWDGGEQGVKTSMPRTMAVPAMFTNAITLLATARVPLMKVLESVG